MAICLATGLVACSPSVDELAPSPQIEGESAAPPNLIESLKVVDGILVLRSEEELGKAISEISQLSKSELRGWAKRIGLNSMYLKYDDFQDYSAESWESGFDRTMAELREEYGKVLTLEDDGMYYLNCTNPIIAKLVDERGVIQVGQNLRRYFKDRYVVIEGGDMAKLELAGRIRETDEAAGLFVFYKRTGAPNTREQCETLNYLAGGDETDIFSNGWCYTPPGGSACAYNHQVEVGNYQSLTSEYMYAYVKTQRRGAFGAWYAYRSNKTISNSSATITGNSGLFEVTNGFDKGPIYAVDMTSVIFDAVNGIPATIVTPWLLTPDGYTDGCVSFTSTVQTGLGAKSENI